MKKFLVVLALICLLLPLAASAGTQTSESYVYNAWSVAVESPPMFVAEKYYRPEDFGLEKNADLKDPQDMFIDRVNKKCYIADAGSNCILRLDIETMKVDKIWRECWTRVEPKIERRIKQGGSSAEYVFKEVENSDGTVEKQYYEKSAFGEPKGVCVDTLGRIYVADNKNARVVVMDQEGFMCGLVLEPDATEALPSTFQFQPLRVGVGIAVNNKPTVYVVCMGGTRGAFMFEASDGGYVKGEKGSDVLDGGKFLGFFGANKVKWTARLGMDQMIKSILPKSSWGSLTRYIPTEISNIFVQDMFVYCVTSAIQGAGGMIQQTDQIKCMNPNDNNILRYEGGSKNYGDLELFRNEKTRFVDVTVDERGFITAIDLTAARMFHIDSEGNTLGIQGKGKLGSAEQMGTTETPSSIENYNGRIWVLDSTLRQITIYKLTEYGENLQNAIYLYNGGYYEEAVVYWHEVLKRNANCELAYTGLGRAYMKKDNYEESLRYLKLGYDKRAYSDVYAQYRSKFISDNFGSFATGALVLVAALIIFLKRKEITAFIRKRRKGGGA